jgi:hypothetical protein
MLPSCNSSTVLMVLISFMLEVFARSVRLFYSTGEHQKLAFTNRKYLLVYLLGR